MKSVFRNSPCNHLGTTAASALIAAIALTVSGCSGAEDVERVAGNDSALSEDEDGASVVGAEPTRVASAEPAATLQNPTRAEQTPTSSRGDDQPAPASSSVESPAASTSESEPTEAEPTEETAAPVHTNTMRVSGRKLLDSCGQPFVVRGVEQILGEQLPQGNDWLGLVREIAATGANAVRILPSVNTLTLGDVDEILTFIGEQGMVAFIDPLNGGDWYAQDDVRAMLKKHERFIIIDAYGEPQYDDIERWHAEAKAALVRMRGLGYEVPFTVYANQYGRALPSLFDYGADILAADPLHNTFLGWQAYWGNNGYYQQHYGYSLTEAVDAIVESGLPIQLGLDHITDLPSTEADYATLMTGAEANGVGWLWWDFYNPYGTENNLSQDGTVEHLTSTGSTVLDTHPASVGNTAKRACSQ